MRNPDLPLHLRVECACHILNVQPPEMHGFYFVERELLPGEKRVTIRITPNPRLEGGLS
jgi:hypothetical protein